MTSQYLRDGTGALTGPTLQQAVFAGTVDPGNIVAVREILATARAAPTSRCSRVLEPTSPRPPTPTARSPSPTPPATEGVDTLRNIETLRFCTANDPVTGSCTAFTDEPGPVHPAGHVDHPGQRSHSAPRGGERHGDVQHVVATPTFVTNTSVRLRNTATLVNVGAAVSYYDATPHGHAQPERQPGARHELHAHPARRHRSQRDPGHGGQPVADDLHHVVHDGRGHDRTRR